MYVCIHVCMYVRVCVYYVYIMYALCMYVKQYT